MFNQRTARVLISILLVFVLTVSLTAGSFSGEAAAGGGIQAAFPGGYGEGDANFGEPGPLEEAVTDNVYSGGTNMANVRLVAAEPTDRFIIKYRKG